MHEKKTRKVEDLDVFKAAHRLALELYHLTERFPKEERFGLVAQMRRAIASVGANLMEGGYRINKKEFRQFVGIARGSVGEMKYFAILARDLGYFTNSDFQRVSANLDDIGKMLFGLIKSLTVTDTDYDYAQ